MTLKNLLHMICEKETFSGDTEEKLKSECINESVEIALKNFCEAKYERMLTQFDLEVIGNESVVGYRSKGLADNITKNALEHEMFDGTYIYTEEKATFRLTLLDDEADLESEKCKALISMKPTEVLVILDTINDTAECWYRR